MCGGQIMLAEMKAFAALTAAIMLWAGDPHLLQAQPSDPPVETPDVPNGRIRYTYVPADEPESWPAGDWMPIRLEEFRRVLQVDAGADPPDAYLESAIYHARLSADSFRGGTLEAVARLRSTKPQFASMGAPSLVLTNLRWDSGDAIWGLDPHNRTRLRVEEDHALLKGRWSLRGRRVLSTTVFDVSVPPAVVSKLKLRIPDAKKLDVEGGLVSAVDASQQSGWTIWSIDLGRATSCRLTISESDPLGDDVVPEIQATQLTKYSLRPDELLLQVDVSIQSFTGSMDTLEFTVPANMQFAPVTVGNEAVLQTNHRREGPTSILEVDIRRLPVLRGTTIRLRGKMPLRLGRPRVLPRVGLRQARWLSIRREVAISRPLQLKEFSADGSQLIDASMNSDAGATLEFEDFVRNGRLELTVDSPQPDLSAAVFSYVECRRSDPLLKSTLRLESASGSAFVIDCDVPSGWEVTRLDASSAAPIAQWSTSWSEADRAARLHIELSKALTPAAPIELVVWARSNTPFADQLADVPAVLPLVSGSRTIDVVIEAPVGMTLEPVAESSFESSSLDVVSDKWERSLPEAGWNIGDDALFVLRATAPEIQEQLRISNNKDVAFVDMSTAPSADHTVTADESPTGADLPDTVELGEPIFASMTVKTVVAIERGGLCRNRATVHFPPSDVSRQVRLRIPRSAELLSAETEGTSGSVTAIDARTLLVALPPSDDPQDVILSYETTLSRHLITGQARIPLPEWNGSTEQVAWEVLLPVGYRLQPSTTGTTAMSFAAVSWSERLLGPLGRSVPSGIFWPFDGESWQRVIGGDPRSPQSGLDATLPDTVTPIFRSVAGGSDSLSLSFWDVSSATRVGWVVLAISLLIGASPHRRKRLLGPAWALAVIIIAVIGAALVPEFLAIPWGGLIVGVCLGALLPERWRGVQGQPRGDRQPDPHSETRVLLPASAAMGSLIVGIVLYSSTARGQQPDSEGDVANAESGRLHSADSVREVLVPLDMDGNGTDDVPPVVYLDRSDLRDLMGSRVLRDPRYLLRSAEYDVSDFPGLSPKVTATFDVLLMRPYEPAYVAIPITNARFDSADVCRVDGEQVTLLPHRNGTDVIVEVPALAGDDAPSAGDASNRSTREEVRHAQVVLECRPLPSPSDDGPEIDLGIPPLVDSQVVFRASGPQAPAIDVLHQGAMTPPSADGRWRIALGAQPHLTAHPADTGPTRHSLIPTGAASVVEAHPMLLKLETRLSFDVNRLLLRLSPPTVLLRLPRRSIVHSVRAPGLDQTRIQANRRGPVLVHLSFGDIAAASVDVEISFDVPTGSTGNEETASVPALEFFDSLPSSTIPEQLIGVSAAPGFRIAVADPEGMMPGATGIDESHLPDWRGPRRIRRAEATFRLSAPRQIELPLSTVSPRITQSIEQTVVIRDGHIDWSAAVTANVLDSGVAQHRLEIDPRLQIRQVRVLQNNIDRLASWARVSSGELVLLLTEPFSGQQSLELTGRLDADPSQQFAAPRIALVAASSTDVSLLEIHHKPELRISVDAGNGTVFNDGELDRSDSESADWEVASVRVADPAPLLIGVSQVSPQRTMDQVTAVTMQKPGTIQWMSVVRIPPDERSNLLEIFVSPSESEVQIEASVSVRNRQIHPDGSVILALDKESVPNEPTVISLSGHSGIDAATVPEIRVSGESPGRHFVIVENDASVEVLNKSAVEASPDEVPSWVPERFPDTTIRRILRVAEPTVQLANQPADDHALILRRVCVGLWHLRDGRWEGVTVADVLARRDGQIAFSQPRGVRFLDVRLDGQSISHGYAEEPIVNVSSSKSLQRLTLFWANDTVARSDGALPLVTPQDLQSSFTQVILFGRPECEYVTPADADWDDLRRVLRDVDSSEQISMPSPIATALRAAGAGRRSGETGSNHLPPGIVSLRLSGVAAELPLQIRDRSMFRLTGLLLAGAVVLSLWFLAGCWINFDRFSAHSESWRSAGIMLMAGIIWLGGASLMGLLLLLTAGGAWLLSRRAARVPAAADSQLLATS